MTRRDAALCLVLAGTTLAAAGQTAGGAMNKDASASAPVARPADPLHAWVGLSDAAGLEQWVQWHLGEERRLIAQVEGASGPRTIANTVEPYDQAMVHLMIAANETYILFSTDANKALRDKAQAMVQVIAAEQTKISLNRKIYEAMQAVHTGEGQGADAPTRHLLERTLLEFRLAGVDKDEATREKVRVLQDRLTELSLKFSHNIPEDVRKVSATRADLEGLPADYIARHKPGPEGTYSLTTDSPDYTPVLAYAKSRDLRRAMYLAYSNRAYPANEAVLMDILRVRQEMATTLGFAHWADLATADMMIGSAGDMKSFLGEVDTASRSRAEREFSLLKAFVTEKDAAAVGDLTQSDANYWMEQYRRAKYDFNSQSVRPYFPYAAVEAGVLQTAARLLHVEFKPAVGATVWNPSVHAYDVFDGGQKAGRIYLDMHPRDGKDKWFSESQLVPGKRGVQMPEAALICNFPGGEKGDPGLMEFSDVVTFFHEFGHMMHEVLGGRQRWAMQSGVSTEGDFVEAPSQMLEEMFHDPAILQSFAKHYQTGETLPLPVIDRMNRASYFGRAYWVQRQLLFSNYSLQVHDEAPAQVNLDGLWEKDTARFSPFTAVAGTHAFASFTHLTGYSSNYYTYVLDKVIAVDFFAAFDPKNLLDGPTALRYRKAVLEPGSSKPAAELVSDFLGRRENIVALEHWMDREFEGESKEASASAKP